MTSHLHRLWQPGNPQLRVFLPNFWIKILKTPKFGRRRLPKNSFLCEVDLRMSELDVREYLEKIYNLPVRDVRTRVVQGDITWAMKLDREKRRALWKEDDRKLAYVFLKKGIEFEYPDIFAVDEEMQMVEKTKEDMKKLEANQEYANRDRKNIATWFGL